MIKIRNATKADKEAIAEFQMAMALGKQKIWL
jgi:hypothetical protein